MATSARMHACNVTLAKAAVIEDYKAMLGSIGSICMAHHWAVMCAMCNCLLRLEQKY
jgi:hypothetical protein